MDLVYICRAGPNEELRYSLRSVAQNLEHDRVWVFGAAPDWLTGAQLVPVQQFPGEGATKWENGMRLFRAIADHPDVSAEFVLMNDDIFVMQPQELVTNHWGPLDEVLARHVEMRSSYYALGMSNTLSVLLEAGFARPLSYELHTPMPMTKAGLGQVQDLIAGERRIPLHPRSLYGNLFSVGGDQVDDVKVYDRSSSPRTALLSTTDKSFRAGAVGMRIRSAFPEPSVYER